VAAASYAVPGGGSHAYIQNSKSNRFFLVSQIPENLSYAKSHEWLRMEADGSATVGISDYAQSSLGDITFLQLPRIGQSLNNGESFGVIESVKAASDVYAPVAGVVVAVNERLGTAPETVNGSPYDAGWLIRLGSLCPKEALFDAAGYRTLIGE
jgi:glycine cleavage system H protein